MKKSLKAGLLILTLVIPALIFTFLQFFANNHYDLPYYHPLKGSDGHVIVENGDTLYNRVAQLKLVEGGDSKSIVVKFKNKVTVVSYLPQKCDDSCQLVLSQLERIYGLRNEIPDLHILTLAEKASLRPAKSNGDGWKVVYAEPESLRKCLEELRFRTALPKNKSGILTSKLALIDRNGFMRGYYDGSDAPEIDRLMAEIKILDYEEKIKKRL